ncbi:MAG: N-6 DNA methylase, partial [Acidobacteriota bacterium]
MAAFSALTNSRKRSDSDPRQGQLPSRGAIEVKPTGDDAWLTADSEQVTRYWKKYRQVLVTNYRDFVLVAPGPEGQPVKVETYRLAESEAEFWAAAAHPRKSAVQQNERFAEFLKRVLQHKATLASPEDVAWFLASYARDALSRIEGVDIPALASIRAALEEALGLKIEDEKGEHFFRSTLVQTLFYGLFSAWVFWAKKHPPTDRKAPFDWHLSVYHLSVPVLRTLFHQLTDPGRLRELKLAEALDHAGAVLNRVDRASFFERFQQEEAVQYFYEPFLKHFDPQLRKALGVYYTPPEIVTYMIERVDRVLREQLNLSDGLADPNVFILDPCCGTGSFLVEAVRRIHRTLEKRGADALTAAELKQAVRERIFGFEILPAPFVVAHLQMGLLLQSLGVPLSEEKEQRASVYLTNALTGWEPPKDPKKKLPFPEFEEEREAAEHVKRDTPILVIIGNPPYDAFAGVSPAEEQGLVEPYKDGLISEWGIKKFNLDDLYVRFFRLAERRIAEMTGKGVACYISNFSYLGDPSFVVMRKQFLEEFDKSWFDCMNGDSRETGKLTPERKPDPSVFSTEFNRQGIRVGTAIGLLVRRGKRDKKPTVRFRHFWGVTKRADLVTSLGAQDFDAQYQPAQPSKSNRFSFRPSKVSQDYLSWPLATQLNNTGPFNGPLERRGNCLIVFEDRRADLGLLEAYLDPKKKDEQIRTLAPRFMKSSGEFKAEKTRSLLKGHVKYDPANITLYPFKPFDIRLAYLDSNIQPL